jgi:integrase
MPPRDLWGRLVLLRFEVTDYLQQLLNRILTRPYRSKSSKALLQTTTGAPMTYNALRKRFDAARTSSGVSFQFRDLRAKNASDPDSLEAAKLRLGHASVTMTERYVRSRIGQKVLPLTPQSAREKK